MIASVGSIEATPVRLVYGIHDFHPAISGLSIAETHLSYKDILSVGEDAEAYLNGRFVYDQHILLRGGDCLEFIRPFGSKAGKPRRIQQSILHGDCLKLMQRRIKKKSVNIVATSPPYNLGIKYDAYDDKRPDSEYLRWLDEAFGEIERVLTDDGSFFLVVGSTPRRPCRAQEVAAVAEGRFQLQNRIIWVKSLAIDDRTFGHYQPINSSRFLNHTFEEVFHFTKTGAVALDRKAIGVPYVDKRNIARWNDAAGNDLRCRGNVWFVPYPTSSGPKQHPAPFPPKLIEMCIRLHGYDEDTLFLDPFG